MSCVKQSVTETVVLTQIPSKESEINLRRKQMESAQVPLDLIDQGSSHGGRVRKIINEKVVSQNYKWYFGLTKSCKLY